MCARYVVDGIVLSGGEESREFGVVPISCSQIVHRSAGSGVAVREPVRAGSTSAGIVPILRSRQTHQPVRPVIKYLQLLMCQKLKRVPVWRRLR